MFIVDKDLYITSAHTPYNMPILTRFYVMLYLKLSPVACGSDLIITLLASSIITNQTPEYSKDLYEPCTQTLGLHVQGPVCLPTGAPDVNCKMRLSMDDRHFHCLIRLYLCNDQWKWNIWYPTKNDTNHACNMSLFQIMNTKHNHTMIEWLNCCMKQHIKPVDWCNIYLVMTVYIIYYIVTGHTFLRKPKIRVLQENVSEKLLC